MKTEEVKVKEINRNIEEMIKNAVKNEQSIYIWGTRSWGCTLGVWFEENDLPFAGYVDNNSKKHGEIIWGEHKCISPQELPAGSLVIITATNSQVNQEIQKQVAKNCRGGGRMHCELFRRTIQDGRAA